MRVSGRRCMKTSSFVVRDIYSTAHDNSKPIHLGILLLAVGHALARHPQREPGVAHSRGRVLFRLYSSYVVNARYAIILTTAAFGLLGLFEKQPLDATIVMSDSIVRTKYAAFIVGCCDAVMF